MITIVQLAGGFVLLLFGAEYMVRGAVALARMLRVSPMAIAMTVVAYGTTAPELVVTMEAVYDGQPGIAVGGIVGSNIANILLVLGVSAAIRPIACKPHDLYRDAAVMMGSALLFSALAMSGTIQRWQGVLMVSALISFSLYTYVSEKRRKDADGLRELATEFSEGPRSAWLAGLGVVGGLAAVISGADLLVHGAVDTARFLGVGEEVIGLTIVAVGTSLPELATAVLAAYRRHPGVAIGNVVGANIYNLLAILGLASVVSPLPVPEQILRFDMWVMLAVTAAMLCTVLLQGRLDRRAATLFLAAFVAYTGLQYIGVKAVFR